MTIDELIERLEKAGGTLQSVHHEHKPYMDGRQWIVTARAGGHHRAQARSLALGICICAVRAKRRP